MRTQIITIFAVLVACALLVVAFIVSTRPHPTPTGDAARDNITARFSDADEAAIYKTLIADEDRAAVAKLAEMKVHRDPTRDLDTQIDELPEAQRNAVYDAMEASWSPTMAARGLSKRQVREILASKNK